MQALGIISQPSVNSNSSYSPETLNLGQNQQFFVPCDLEISWTNDLEQGQSEGFDSCDQPSNPIQIGFKLWIFLDHVILKFGGWPRKTKGHLFYTTSSFVHHFKSICELKLELQYGNAQFRSKSTIFGPVWPWNWHMTLVNNRAPFLYYIKLCASF